MHVDYIIVGQGLAGSLLSFFLDKNNKSFMLVDDHHLTCASLVAAGIMNPITGKRLTLNENFERLLNQASITYRLLENRLDTSFYHEKDIVRIYQSSLEHKHWSESKDTLKSQQYVKSFNPSGLFHQWIKDPYGSLNIKGHLCHIARFLSAYREHLLAKQQLIDKPFIHDQLNIREDGVQYNHITASKIIFCEGCKASDNPFFQYLPFKHAKGEILTIRNDGPPLPDKIFHFGKWMFPVSGNKIKIGTTHHWENINNITTTEAREEILKAARPFLNFSFEVVHQQAAVRPVIVDINPVIGLHALHPAIGIFNGLGSKGALYAPYYAHQLASHLIKNEPLEAQVNITRFNI